MADVATDFGTRLPDKIKNSLDAVKGIDAVFQFKITGEGGGSWVVDCKNNPGVRQGEEEADVTLELSADDWKTISATPSAAMQLYFTGKLKVTGNAMLATKLQKLLG